MTSKFGFNDFQSVSSFMRLDKGKIKCSCNLMKINLNSVEI